MELSFERARKQGMSANEKICQSFKEAAGTLVDAIYIDAERTRALGFMGLPYEAPVCQHIMADAESAAFIDSLEGDVLLVRTGAKLACRSTEGRYELAPALAEKMLACAKRTIESEGALNDRGELELDLKSYQVGPHYAVNLLLGNRAGYPYPLMTTPKSALDAFGRGSFRATGGEQVLATRYVLDPSQNGEPANRQFYLTEQGRKIFYSADAETNVASAKCVHSQGRTVITYETEDGLRIARTIFLLPQEKGLPSAIEAQRIEIENTGAKARTLRLVATGVFGIAPAATIAGDDVYANIVQESEVVYADGDPAAITMYAQPKEERNKKRFAFLSLDGKGMDEFCSSEADFIGDGTLSDPELLGHLPNRLERKNAPFWAIAKTFNISAGETKTIDEIVGMSGSDGDDVPFEDGLAALLAAAKDPAWLGHELDRVKAFWDTYPDFFRPETGDANFDAYVGHNLPFQVLYQTYVSRAFAWTQKSYRETGFREIQDIYASMYYLCSMGEAPLVRNLISMWVSQVWRAGYAYHDFTFKGKEPGDCSDDQLWLFQAVARYVKLTGDTDFLAAEYPIAGEEGAKRSLWDTLKAILVYSGCVSVGAHGLPLLDKADWNDTLRLDKVVYKGPAKEKLYRAQLEAKGQEWGAAWENDQSESVMNACLLKIAADEFADMAAMTGKDEDGAWARALSQRIAASVQKSAWKDDYFARCLMNDGRGYDYLGATGDRLAMDPDAPGTYYLNSFSWPILAGIATEDQIRSMLAIVNERLRTKAGLKLCTLVDFDRLGVKVGTALYFPGDRENSGVFKHAAMMATVAALKAARTVTDEKLASDLSELAHFMIGRTLPYRTLEDPFVLKGNPRFCTQYNNSETGENIGPMLSGTATWLTLALLECAGADPKDGTVSFSPVLAPNESSFAYTLGLGKATLHVEVASDAGHIRCGAGSTCTFDGKPSALTIPVPAEGTHTVEIRL
jgi:cellobiose phosphorylase